MTNRLKYAYDCEFLEDGRTIELISIGLVCEDGREYYAVNSDMPVDRIKAHPWLMDNVWPSLPLRGEKSGLVSVGGGRHEVKLTEPGVLDTSSVLVKPKWVIANEVREFLVGGLTPAGERDGKPFYFDTDLPELWADWGAYDHVVLCQLWGAMIKLPKGLPMFTRDIEQELDHHPGFEKPVQAEGLHNALQDARHNMVVLRALGVAS